MDEAQVKALIEASMASGIRGAFQEFRGYFQEQLAPLTKQLAEFEVASVPNAEPEPKASKKAEGSNDAMAALTARLASMEKMEADRQVELKTYKFGNELSNNIGKYDTIHGDLVKELLSNRYGSKVIEKDGKYYTASGTTLDEEIDGFFKSDTGSHFLKAPATTSSTTAKSSTTATGQKGEVSVDDMLADIAW